MYPLHLSPRHVVQLTIAAFVVIAVFVALLGDDIYRRAKRDAEYTVTTSLAKAEHRIDDYNDASSDLQLALKNAQQLLDDSVGQTVDESTRVNLSAVISAVKTSYEVQTSANTSLVTLVNQVHNSLPAGLAWPPNVLAQARALDQNLGANADSMVLSVVSLGESMRKTQEAHSSWHAEQARIAAEREAAQRRVTPPNVISAPATPLPSVAGFDVESYVHAMVPTAMISWVAGLCDGSYVCGRTWLGGAPSTPVKIELDPAKRDSYSNRVGRSVLVHEAAHARQWSVYGAGYIITSERQSGLTGIPAVEYMADCATIAKLGYSTGAYTGSCTAAQLQSIAAIW